MLRASVIAPLAPARGGLPVSSGRPSATLRVQAMAKKGAASGGGKKEKKEAPKKAC